MHDDEGFVTLTAADALRRAPPGERVRLRAGTTITEEVNVLQPVLLLAEADVTMKGKLVLQGGSFAAAHKQGVVRGLKLRHFMEEAAAAGGDCPPPCLRTAPHPPAWCAPGLRPLLSPPERSLSSLEARRSPPQG